MRSVVRLAFLALLFGGITAQAQTGTPPQRPFAQLVELWTRQLDRIAYRADQADVMASEIDTLREQATDVRTAALAAAQLARNDLADVRRLLAPLEARSGTGQPPETDAVKAERERLTAQAAISESRVKQCEVVIARADQLLERLTSLRGKVVLQTLLHREAPPLSDEAWRTVGPELSAAVGTLASALQAWGRDGLGSLAAGGQALAPLVFWAVVAVVLWGLARALRRRYGRRGDIEPGRRDRTLVAAIDGFGLVIVPILAVWLIAKLLLASQPPPPIDALLPELAKRLSLLLLVTGLAARGLAPEQAAWRVLPFTDASARFLLRGLRRLLAVGLTLDFVYLALTQGADRSALASVGALVLSLAVAALALPILGNRAWEAARPQGSDRPAVVGGALWSLARLLLSIAVLAAIGFALLGYATLADRLHVALASTCLLVGLALVAHRIAADVLEAASAPDSVTGIWVRRRFGLPPDAALRSQPIALLLVDFLLVLLLAAGIPAAWSVDTEAILSGFGQIVRGVKIGGITLSLRDLGLAVVAFGVCMVLARLVRGIVRDRVMPTVDAPLPLRQSIDAVLNYLGVLIAALVAIGALGIDFTNLAIVLGALSVGIGLGLQNIANNIISGVFLLVERPIKAGDWVSVAGHEGFVRRINIRATEIETFQRTHVIVPNSVFLQNPVINRTYADTSSRIDIPITVGLGTDTAKMETILRETALAHPRVLRVPAPIVRFVRVAPTGLEFELYVFVALLEDRVVVTNDLNRALLARLIAERIIDPAPAPEFRVRGLDTLAAALRTDHGAAPPSR